jgi:D-beta-D-heptose 7-phosphate kinase/D-beta-D-heptose 1-phosphate adenosyltransferase
LLEQARAACDRLIVGLNDDISVRRQKGVPHPVQPEPARAAVLASFACVDLVCLYEEDTPEALIEVLRPDVLIKGANHAAEDVAGADMVRSWGGRVMQIDLLQEQLPQPGLATLRG